VFAHVVATNGSLGYYSHIIVNKDSPYNTLEDILKCDKTLDFGIGDPNSTSGFLVPTAYIFAAKGIDPKSCFKTVRNANHQANAMAVANKQVAAATNNSEDLQRVGVTAPQARERIKIIWTSPMIPLDPIVWRKDLDPAIKTKIYTFLLSYGRIGTPDEIKAARELIAAMIWSPLRPSSDDQLIPMRKLEASRDLLRLQSDAKLSDEEKKKESADIQAQLAKLDEMEKKAAGAPFQAQLAAFVKADEAGDQAALKRMIADFAAGNGRTN
jgi:phosphonate transport system substrate-binding protein